MGEGTRGKRRGGLVVTESDVSPGRDTYDSAVDRAGRGRALKAGAEGGGRKRPKEVLERGARKRCGGKKDCPSNDRHRQTTVGVSPCQSGKCEKK